MSSKGKVIVTGAAGFIGTNTVSKFIESGYEVIGMDNLQRKGVYKNLGHIEKLYKDKFKFIWGDVRNTTDIDRLPTDSVAIIHLAANPGIPRSLEQPLYDFEVNAKGTVNMLEFARKTKTGAFIYSSTNKVYSDAVNQIALIEGIDRYDIANGVFEKLFFEGASPLGFSEVFSVDGVGEFPHSPYGCSKYMGDVYCQEFYHAFNVPAVVNRQSCIGGLFQHGVEDQGWFSWFCLAKMREEGLNIYGNGKQVRDVLDGRDLAELYLMEVEQISRFAGQVFNVGGGIENSVSLLEVIKYLDSEYIDEFDKFRLDFKDWRLADHKVYISDITKIKKFGWAPKIKPFQCIDNICKHIKDNPDIYS